MERFIPEVNTYEVSKVKFSSCWRWSRIMVLFRKLAPKIEGWIWETSLEHHDSGSGEFMQICKLFIFVLMETWGVILAWRSVSILRRGLLGRTRGMRKLCIVFCHSFYIIYGSWRSKEMGGGREIFQSSYVEGKPQRRGK